MSKTQTLFLLLFIALDTTRTNRVSTDKQKAIIGVYQQLKNGQLRRVFTRIGDPKAPMFLFPKPKRSEVSAYFLVFANIASLSPNRTKISRIQNESGLSPTQMSSPSALEAVSTNTMAPVSLVPTVTTTTNQTPTVNSSQLKLLNESIFNCTKTSCDMDRIMAKIEEMESKNESSRGERDMSDDIEALFTFKVNSMVNEESSKPDLREADLTSTTRVGQQLENLTTLKFSKLWHQILFIIAGVIAVVIILFTCCYFCCMVDVSLTDRSEYKKTTSKASRKNKGSPDDSSASSDLVSDESRSLLPDRTRVELNTNVPNKLIQDNPLFLRDFDTIRAELTAKETRDTQTTPKWTQHQELKLAQVKSITNSTKGRSEPALVSTPLVDKMTSNTPKQPLQIPKPEPLNKSWTPEKPKKSAKTKQESETKPVQIPSPLKPFSGFK